LNPGPPQIWSVSHSMTTFGIVFKLSFGFKGRSVFSCNRLLLLIM